MPALIVINQATRPAGTAGKARSDGVAAQLVTCTNSTAEGSYLWTLIDVPIRSALVRGTTGTGASFTFTPDVKGTYLVSLQVNGSAAAGDNDRSYIALVSSGVKALGWRYQGAGETTEDNESYPGYGFPGNVNPRGWATSEDEKDEQIESAVWDVENAVSVFGGANERLVKTDPATGKIHPTVLPGLTPTGPAGADLAGVYPNPTVVALRGRAISSVFSPADGQALVWDSAGNAFKAANIAVSGGLGGVSAGLNQATSGVVVFSNANNMTFGMDGSGVVTASAAGGGGGGGIAAAAGTQTATSGTVAFADGNGVTFGMSGSNQITASIPAGATATGNLGGFSAGTQLRTSGTVSFANSNGLSFGLDAGTVTGSYTVPSVAGLLSNINLSAGTTSANLSAFTLSNSNNMSFGLNGGVLTGSASFAQSTAPAAFAAGTQVGTSGTLSFVNSNGLTFGLSGSSQLTGSYTVPSVAGLLSNIRLSAGTTSNLLSAFTLSNSNNVSFGLNAGTVTASVPAGVTATGNFGALAAGTQTATSGTVSFANSNGLSFGMSGSNQITGSYTVPSVAGLISNINLSAGTTSANLSAVTFGNANGVTFGLNAGTVTASVAPGGGGGIAAAAGTQTATSGTVAFANSNGMTFGMSGSNQITASYSQSTAPAALSFLGPAFIYTSGTVYFPDTGNVSWSTNAGSVVPIPFIRVEGNGSTVQASRVSFVNSNGITFGVSTGAGVASVTASVASSLTAINVSAGTTSNNLSALTFANGGGISFGLNNGTVTATVVPGAAAGIAAISAGTEQVTIGTVLFSNANGVSFGLNNSSLTASVQLNATVSSYEPFPLHNTGTAALSWATNTSAPMSLIPIVFVQDVAADVVNVVVSMSFATGGTSSFNQSGTLGWGLYSRVGQTGSLLALMGSSSLDYYASYNNSTMTLQHATETKGAGGYNTATLSSAGLNISSGYTGLKLMQLNLGSTVTPGQYWLGLHHRNSSSSFNSGLRMSFIGNANSLTGLAPWGSFSSVYSRGTNVSRYGGQGGNFLLAHGSYSINAMTALTASVSLSRVTQNLTVVPYMKFIAPVS